MDTRIKAAGILVVVVVCFLALRLWAMYTTAVVVTTPEQLNGAVALLDGRRIGAVSNRILDFSVRPGAHTLRLEAQGWEVVEIKFEARRDEELYLSVSESELREAPKAAFSLRAREFVIMVASSSNNSLERTTGLCPVAAQLMIR